MPTVRYELKCFNKQCAAYNKAVELILEAGKPARCQTCLQVPTGNALKVFKPPTPLEIKFKEVLDLVPQNASQAERAYLKALFAWLETGEGSKWQGDFLHEMGKEEDRKKLAGAGARTSNGKSNCVDDAIAGAGDRLQAGWPKGEKFNFEVPYLLKQLSWTYASVCSERSMLEVPLKTVLAWLKANPVDEHRQYLLVRAQHQGTSESHMVQVVVKAKNAAAYLHDKQKAPNDYGSGYAELWSKPAPYAGPVPFPCCTLDLVTGATGAFGTAEYL